MNIESGNTSVFYLENVVYRFIQQEFAFQIVDNLMRIDDDGAFDLFSQLKGFPKVTRFYYTGCRTQPHYQM